MIDAELPCLVALFQHWHFTQSSEAVASQSAKLTNAPAVAGAIPTAGGRPSFFIGRGQWLARRVFSIDLRSLAALRIGLSLLLLIDLFERASDLTAHYSDAGLMPRGVVIEKVLESPWCISLHLISGAAPVIALLFAIAALFACSLLVGFHTRLSVVVSWFLLLSLHNRNPMILQGGDVLLRMLLFWGMFLPLGARYSLDSYFRMTASGSSPEQVFSAASVAMLLQVAFMYWFSVFLKTDPVWFRDYTAVYYALSLDHFVTPLGKLLLPYHTLLKAFTFSTLWLEAIGPIAALLGGVCWWPVRFAVILAFAAFHVSMGLCLNLGLFSVICCVAWLVYLPCGFWEHIAKLWHHPRSPSFALQKLAGKLQGVFYVSPTRAPAGVSARFNYSSKLSQVITSFFLVYVLLWNLRTINPQRYTRILPHASDWLGLMFGVGQCWDMFSPSPLKEDGWFVMPAQLQDGSEVDLWKDGAPVHWEKPKLVSAMYKNDRWRKYMVVLAAAVNTDRRSYFAQYMCRRWNQAHPPAKQIRTLRIYLMEEDTLPNYEVSKPRPVLLWTHQCAS